jgi:uncharacterized membrane protein
MKSWFFILDLIMIIILSLFTIIVVFSLPEGNILRILMGIPFLIFYPGYALVSLLWPRMSDMENLERIGLSFGLSIIIIIMLGLILNYTPAGLDLSSIAFSSFGFIILAVLLAWFRRMRIPEENRYYARIAMDVPKGELSKTDKIVTVLIIISLITAGAALGYVILSPKEGERFTEFYILDKNGTTEDYPKDLQVGENGTIIVGIENHEGSSMNYSITINLINRTDVTNETWNFYADINDNEKLEFDFNFSIVSSDTYRLEFILYREFDSEPYHELHLNEIAVRD